MAYSDRVDYRLYRPVDFAPLYAIEELCFEPPFRFGRHYMRQLVDSIDTATWIAEEEGRMAGFAIVEHSVEGEERSAYIQTIEVAPTEQRKGVGHELLLRMEESARTVDALEIWLHVDEANLGAIALYRAHGYEKLGRQPHYYARNRAAEIYRKLLTAGPF